MVESAAKLVPDYNFAQRALMQILPSQAFAQGQQVSFDIPVDALMEQLLLRLDVSFIPTVVTAAGTVAPWNPVELIKRITLTLGDHGVKKQLDALTAYIQATIRNSQPPSYDFLTQAEANAPGTYPLHCEIPLDLASFGVTPGELGLIVGKRYATITLDVVFGTIDDLFTGAHTYTYTMPGTLSLYRRNLYCQSWNPAGYGHQVEMQKTLQAIVAGQNDGKLTPFRRHRSLLTMTRVAKATSGHVFTDLVLNTIRARLESTNYVLRAQAPEVRANFLRLFSLNPIWARDDGLTTWCGIYYHDWGKVLPHIPTTVASALDGVRAAEVWAEWDCNVVANTILQYAETFWDPVQ